jgi:CRISPR-associated endonuclease/helicase Cas3
MSGIKLACSDFKTFFKALWGNDADPFPWQEELLRRLATTESGSGCWPDVLDLPTGSGKTAALDIAVFHLALEAENRDRRRAPLRIAFVVDRRLIVDDAHRRAQRIADALRWCLLGDEEAAQVAAKKRAAGTPDLAELIRRVRAEPVVRHVALRLRRLAGEKQPPLMARALRGGAPLEDDWAHTPVQPTILCSTVDQVGSRLLFRGYGVRDNMKPVHAGLLGSDCLILLDEAHLSAPFEQTLTSIKGSRDPDAGIKGSRDPDTAIKSLRVPDAAPFEFAVLTATPAERPAERQVVRFGLTKADRDHPVLFRRLTAEKKARLVEVAGKQGVDTESRRADVAAEHARSVISELVDSGIACPAVGVVLNRVSRARSVFEQLKAELKEEDADLVLLIGPARAADRDRHASLLDPIRTQKFDAPRNLVKPLIVVATQTIEAGVDIDFDGLVTEAAPLDALRQRFGRLNRAGRGIKPEAVILAHKEDFAKKADDAVYGDRLRTTWDALIQWQANAPDGTVDFGIRSMEAVLETEPKILPGLVTEKPVAPVFMPAYADLLSWTSPIPKADPDVALFLHGPNRSQPTVRIVWRADILEKDLRAAWRNPSARDGDADEDRERLIDLLTLMPPRAAEAVEVPLWAARAWLERPSASQAEFSDAVDRRSEETADQNLRRPAFRWAGKDDKRADRERRPDDQRKRSEVIGPGQLRDDNLIVVPASYGGCDKWGWKPDSVEPVTDLADDAAEPYRKRRFAVRVTPELIVQGLRADNRDPNPDISERLTAALPGTGSTTSLLEAVRELKFLPDNLRKLLALLDHRNSRRSPKEHSRRGLQHEFVYDPGGQEPHRGIVFLAPYGLKEGADAEEDIAAVPSTENDDLGAISDGAILLSDHSQHVRNWADGFCDRAGLERKVREDVALSSYLHDLGKADGRYQAYYAGGNPYGPDDPYGPDAKKVLAKSGQGRLPRGAWERAGLPANWRHEALSVRLAQILLESGQQAHDHELVLWLIGTHHGYGRPLFQHADPKDAECRRNLLRAFNKADDLPPGNGPQSIAFRFNDLEWAQMFERLKRRYGIWGLARLEAFVRLSDHRASEAAASPDEARPDSVREAAE